MSVKPVTVMGVYVSDFSLFANKLPSSGETVVGSQLLTGPGGKGSNQAIAACKASGCEMGRVNFISRIGADSFGDEALALWDASGLRPLVVRDTETATGVAAIFIDRNSGENAIMIVPGASGKLSPADLDAHEDVISNSALFMTQLEQPLETAVHGLRLARSSNVITLLNPAPAVHLSDECLSLCDFLTPNETEAEVLTGVKITTLENAEVAAKMLRHRGAKTVVITLGAQGVYVCNTEESFHVEAMTCGRVVDTSGAGDAFNGAFALALSDGLDVKAAAQFGCAFAGLSVTRLGTANAMPSREETLKLLGTEDKSVK